MSNKMELSKEEYIKLKQKEYYLSKYKDNNIKKKVINKFYNDNNEDGMKNIYSAACSRIRETIKKYNLNIKFSYLDMLGCVRTEFKKYIIDNLLEGMTLENFGEWEMDHTIPISSFKFESMDEIKTCFNYKNIKPMWKSDNRHKSYKI
jgi:hypothetical protein